MSHGYRARPIPSPPVSTSSVASTSPGTPDDGSSSLPSPKGGNKTGARKESEQRRRLMMNQYFDELITLLAMVSERNIPKKMDKATTLKEAVNCIRIYYELGKAGSPSEELPKMEPKSNLDEPEFKPSFLSGGEIFSFFLEARDTFLIIVAESGRILYSTNLITSLLGHMQSRLVGQNIFDYILEEDKELIIRMLEPSDPTTGVQMPDSPVIQYPCQTFQCHMKLHSGETSLYPQFLPFSCLSFLRQWSERFESSSQPSSPLDSDMASPLHHEQQSCILLLGKLPTSLTGIDLPISTNDVSFEFEMRVSKEGTIIHIDEHAMLVFGFTASELIGSSIFDYIDPYHLIQVGEAMAGFLSTGLGTTTPYRILSKGSRYIWLISKGYLSYNPWNHKPDHILLSNRILGCDDVLPEHRFFRSRKLLPDVDGEEPYVPIQSPVSPPPPVVPTSNVSVPYSLPISSDPILPSPQMVTADLGPPTNGVLQSQPESFMDVQKELERKTQELFDLQQKLLEQQQLMEQERMQFYQVTQQVMQCIGNSSSCSGIPSNLQTAVGNFSQTSMPSMPSPSPKHSFKSPQSSMPKPVLAPSPVPAPSPKTTPAPSPNPATPIQNSSWCYSDVMASHRNPNYLPTYTLPPPSPTNQSLHNPLIPPYAQSHHHQHQQSISASGYPFNMGGNISLLSPTSPYSVSTPSAHFRNPSPFQILTHSTLVRPTTSQASLPSHCTSSQMPSALSNLLGLANTTAGTPTTSSCLPEISDSSLNSLSGHLQQNLPPACYSQNILQPHQPQQHYGSYEQPAVTCVTSELATQTGAECLRNLLCIANSDNSSSSRSNIMRITTCTSME